MTKKIRRALLILPICVCLWGLTFVFTRRFLVAILHEQKPTAITTTTDTTEQTFTSIRTTTNKTHTKKERPTLVLHVGLPKTATTFLQCVLCQNENQTAPILGQDNYVYLGTCSRSFCQMTEINENFLKHRPDSFFANPVRDYNAGANHWGAMLHDDDDKATVQELPLLSDELVSKLENLKKNNLNGIIVYEGAHRFSRKHIAALANYTNTRGFDVQVVVAYRRLVEWLPSKYNSKIKWRGNDDAWPEKTELRHIPFDITDRKDFSDLFDYMESVKLHPAAIVAQNYQRHFTTNNVTIMDLHHLWTADSHGDAETSGDPMLQHLFCKVIRDAPNTCQAAIRDELGRAYENNYVDLSFDALAVKAYQAGLITKLDYRRQPIHRRDVVWKAKNFFAAVQKKWEDYERPLKCLPESSQNRILNFSITTEKNLLGDAWSPEMETMMAEEHRQAFEGKKDKLVCSVDVDKMLLDELWIAFFLSLENRDMHYALHQQF